MDRYAFESHAVQQNFLSLLLLLRRLVNTGPALPLPPAQLRLFVTSLNCGNAPIPTELGEWIPRDLHDIVVVGTQESISDADIYDKIGAHLGSSYLTVATATLLWIRLIVLVRREHWTRISNLEKHTVATGVGGVVGNKGASGISFCVDGSHLAFLSCHLASGDENNAVRKENVKEIIHKIRLR